ncbi:hypothetical protein DMC30DRAFT_445529, partial [Rhodotorula diobovata]
MENLSTCTVRQLGTATVVLLSQLYTHCAAVSYFAELETRFAPVALAGIGAWLAVLNPDIPSEWLPGRVRLSSPTMNFVTFVSKIARDHLRSQHNGRDRLRASIESELKQLKPRPGEEYRFDDRTQRFVFPQSARTRSRQAFFGATFTVRIDPKPDIQPTPANLADWAPLLCRFRSGPERSGDVLLETPSSILYSSLNSVRTLAEALATAPSHDRGYVARLEHDQMSHVLAVLLIYSLRHVERFALGDAKAEATWRTMVRFFPEGEYELLQRFVRDGRLAELAEPAAVWIRARLSEVDHRISAELDKQIAEALNWASSLTRVRPLFRLALSPALRLTLSRNNVVSSRWTTRVPWSRPPPSPSARSASRRRASSRSHVVSVAG